jgi:hypothetical protein
MKTIWDQTKYSKCVLNDRHSVAMIHQAIINNISVAEASKDLGLKDPIILASHLGKFVLDGEVLNFRSFKELSLERAREIWGSKYQQPMFATEIKVRDYSAFHIYQVIRNTKTIREAASLLGIRDHSLERLLWEHKFENKRLTFKSLKNMYLTGLQLSKIFVDVCPLDAPEQRINLTPDVPLNFWGTQEPEMIENAEDDFDQLALNFAGQFETNDLLSNSFFSNTSFEELAPVQAVSHYYLRPRKNRK